MISSEKSEHNYCSFLILKPNCKFKSAITNRKS